VGTLRVERRMGIVVFVVLGRRWWLQWLVEGFCF
jgi:hypothetical protein